MYYYLLYLYTIQSLRRYTKINIIEMEQCNILFYNYTEYIIYRTINYIL